MTVLVLACLLVLITCMGACLYRIVVAPDALNRLLAFDLMGVLISLAVALFVVIKESWVYLEISMGLAVLALVATIAIAHFIERESIF
jgi:multisubunit Na+/H+ antiporter MnhF subunit